MHSQSCSCAPRIDPRTRRRNFIRRVYRGEDEAYELVDPVQKSEGYWIDDFRRVRGLKPIGLYRRNGGEIDVVAATVRDGEGAVLVNLVLSLPDDVQMLNVVQQKAGATKPPELKFSDLEAEWETQRRYWDAKETARIADTDELLREFCREEGLERGGESVRRSCFRLLDSRSPE